MVYSAKSDDANTISQFTRRKTVTITTGGTSTPANYQVKLTITHESEMQSDFDDIRFNTKSRAYIDYWIESYIASTSAVVWIELPDAITDPGSDAIWMYYGNTTLSNEGDIGDTFLFGDDFSGDLSKWTQKAGTWNIVSGELDAPATDYAYILNTISFDNYIAEYRMKVDLNQAPVYQRMDNDPYATKDGYMGYLRWANTESRIDEFVNGSLSNLQTEVSQTISSNYHRVKFTANGSNLVFYNYDEVTENSETVSTTDSTRSSGYIGFGTFSAGHDTLVDWVFVRKYIANEPTPSYGTSQHQRRVPQFM